MRRPFLLMRCGRGLKRPAEAFWSFKATKAEAVALAPKGRVSRDKSGVDPAQARAYLASRFQPKNVMGPSLHWEVVVWKRLRR